MAKKDEKASNSAKLLEFWKEEERKQLSSNLSDGFGVFEEMFGDFGLISSISAEHSIDSRTKIRIRMISDEFHDMDVFGRIAGENGYSVDELTIDTRQNHDRIYSIGSRFISEMRPTIREIEYDMVLTEILI